MERREDHRGKGISGLSTYAGEHIETVNFGVRDITWTPWGSTQRRPKSTYQSN